MTHPAACHLGVELGLAGEFVDRAGLDLRGSVRGPNVVAGLLLDLLADTGELLALAVLQHVLAIPAFLLDVVDEQLDTLGKRVQVTWRDETWVGQAEQIDEIGNLLLRLDTVSYTHLRAHETLR